ncbi:hypothetical protein [Pseudonocardia sp. ICBG1293]|uniref:hypothetical protein n=1 Tax=Pseudonocardia sp. ICBG1293 TaxID=2844382 RepID=UPI001CCB45E1|nr:hypothetical protein [Pseudonocardia sp. ICBG1293]
MNVAAQIIITAIGISFLAAITYKVNEIRRDPSNWAAWGVVTILFALMIATTVRENSPIEFLSTYGSTSEGVVFRNIPQAMGFFGLQLLHLYKSADGRLRRKRLLLEAAALCATIVAMCVLAVTLPPGVSLYASDENLAHFHVLLFYYVIGGYVLYCLISQLRWNIIFARTFRNRLLRWSAAVAAAGDLLLICTRLSRDIGQSFSHFVSGERPLITSVSEKLFVVTGFPTLIVGLLLPAMVDGFRNLAHLYSRARRWQKLRPLNDAIKWAYPGLQRPAQPTDTDTDTDTDNSLLNSGRCKLAQLMRDISGERVQRCQDGYGRNRNNDTGGRPLALARVLDSLPEAGVPFDTTDDDQVVKHLISVSLALGRVGPIYLKEYAVIQAEPENSSL